VHRQECCHQTSIDGALPAKLLVFDTLDFERLQLHSQRHPAVSLGREVLEKPLKRALVAVSLVLWLIKTVALARVHDTACRG
jgi:hypothetical protein